LRVSPALVLASALFAVGIDAYIVVAILPDIASDLNRSVASVGLLASAYSLPLGLLAIPFGPVSDRLGRRFSMLLGMGLFVAAAIACGLAPSYELLLVARAVNGVGAGILGPAVFAYASDVSSPEQRGRAIASIIVAFPISTVLGLPLGGLIAAAAGWRAVFGFIAVVALGALVLLWRLPADAPRPGSAVTYRQGIGLLARSRSTLGAVSVTFVWFTASFGLFTYLGSFFAESFGFSTVEIGLTLTIIGFVGLAATRSAARLIDRLGAKRVVLIGIACFTVAGFLLPWTTVFLPWALANMALWVFGTWFGLPAQQALISELVPTARGTALAANTSALYLGGTVGPAVTGAVLHAGGFPLAGLWSAGVGLAALGLAAVVLPSRVGDTAPAGKTSAPDG
jgi:MFS transporter, DHA1 family, inner membrane transport protein